MNLIEARGKMLNLQHSCAYCSMCFRVERMVSAYDEMKKITEGLTNLVGELIQGVEGYDTNKLLREFPPVLQRIITYQQNNSLSQLYDALEDELSRIISTEVCDLTRTITFERISFLEKNINSLYKNGQETAAEKVQQYSTHDISFQIVPELSKAGDISFRVEYADIKKEQYITGRLNPYNDALLYALYNSKDENMRYVLAGCSMIYEALALLKVNYGVTVFIYEPDIAIARQILRYIDVSTFIESGRLFFSFGENDVLLSKSIAEGNLLTKADPMSLFDASKKQLMVRYRSLVLPTNENSQILTFNFNKNKSFCDSYVNELVRKINGKEVYIVAGGPSLSPCIPVLKKRSSNSILLCVGTSAKKIMDEGIIPDYIVLIDGLLSTKKQLSHSFNYDVTSFIYLATACSETVSMFEGKRYIVYQEGFELSEKAASELGAPTYRTGGSVSTLALDLAVKLGASKVICLGLDLAYTYNQFHASGISEENDLETTQGNIILKDTSGGMVKTASTLAAYHDWIEKYIADAEKLPELLNISDGAYIEGMKNITVSEALKML